MATNGLSKSEEKLLRDRLQQLNEILTRRCLMGGGEARLMIELAARIHNSLNPPEPAMLDSEAEEMIALHSGLDWVQAALDRAKAA